MSPETLIECGWCGAATVSRRRCSACHRDPALPWVQRRHRPPKVTEHEAGRPPLDPGQIRQRLRIARKELGPDPTNAALAEHLGISERTLGRWLKVAD